MKRSICNASGNPEIKIRTGNVTPKPNAIEVRNNLKDYDPLTQTRLNVLIPAAATIPNITSPTPPNTGCGIPLITPANLGNRT